MTTVKKKREIYCFDTSAFLALSRTDERVIGIDKAIWQRLEVMMKAGVLISHQIVYDEVLSGTKNPPFIIQWIKNKKKHFYPRSDAQVNQIPRIVTQFPDLIDPSREHEQADPWLIALAMEKSHDANLFEVNVCIVVSQENPNSSKKIPAACRYFKVSHCSLREFFDGIGLTTKIARK